jgi:HlyD family secretion protein
MNKKIVIGILIILILGSGYFYFGKASKNRNQTRYVLTKVERGTVLTSVSGTGQIKGEEEKEIKPKVSGDVLKIYVQKDQKVKEGDLLLEIDQKPYQRALDSAKLSLDLAKIDFENLKQNKEEAQKDLDLAFENAFSSISGVFGDLSSIFSQIEPFFTESSYNSDQADIDYYFSVVGLYGQQKFGPNDKENEFSKIKEKYQNLKNQFLLVSRFSSRETIKNWLKETQDFIKKLSDLTRTARNTASFYKESIQKENLTPPFSLSITENQIQVLSQVTLSLDQKDLNLTSLKKTIENLETSISNLEDKIRSQEKLIKQKEDAVSDAKENYDNCFVRAPFDGIVGEINVKEKDSVSPQTSLFTFISTQKIAKIFLNEIDAAKAKVGQKATLTFDALPDLTLTGRVIEIDTVGTVSQGVTSYGVKISLDLDDERIKSEMSVNAEIVVDVKANVLTLPNSAIKSDGNLRYVQLIAAPKEIKDKLKIGGAIVLPKEVKIKNQPVKIGISNDEKTEILSGVSEGDIVISSKITRQAQTTQTRSMFQFPGMIPQRR